MADKIAFDLVSPERLLLSEEADMVTIPGTEGEMGVMAGHMPLITTLRPGVVSVSGGREASQRYVVLGGFAEINQTKVTVLADEAVPAADFTEAVLDQRITAADEAIAAAKSEVERAKAQFFADSLRSLRSGL
jgi:F-type H+-transporting ATPase subunit epsilon